MQIDLRNQIAVVTGASGQLGRVMARTLAACGADIAIHYHANRESAENVLRDVRAAGARVAEMALARVAGHKPGAVAEVWPVQLIVRGSTAAAPERP